MKTQNRIRAKSSAAKVQAQTKIPAKKRPGAGRVRVYVRMPRFLSDAVDQAAKRLGITRDEFFENAIREKMEDGKGGAR
ncbi:MAG: hypothetical protein ABI042_10525 [Verrucomicrobiota bacterium]